MRRRRTGGKKTEQSLHLNKVTVVEEREEDSRVLLCRQELVFHSKKSFSLGLLLIKDVGRLITCMRLDV